MKPDEKDVQDILDGALTRHGNLSQEHVDSAMDRAWEKLQANMTDAPAWKIPEGSPSRTPRLIFLAACFAPVLVVVVILLLATVIVPNLIRRNSVYAVVETSESEIKTGTRINPGEIVSSTGPGSVVLSLRDGSRIEMRAQSELALERADDGVRIRLSKGGVIVNAAKQRNGHLYVQTKDVTVSVVGTVFFVNAEETGSRVAVIQGEVRVQLGATSKSLRPGEQVATNPLMESHLVSEEISWSRSAPEHMALLQQSAAQRGTSTAPSGLKFEVVSIRPSTWRGPRGPEVVAPGESLGFGCHGTDGIPRAPFNGGPQIPIPQGRCVGNGVTVALLMNYAYGSPWRFGSGIPDWARARTGTFETEENQEHFQIEAAAENPETTTTPQLKLMLQTMLADRFKLQLHRETQDVQAYVFHVAKNGPKLKEATGDIEMPTLSIGVGMHGKTSLDTLAQFLTEFVIGFANLGSIDSPFINKTGLTGTYDYAFRLRPASGGARGGGDGGGPPSRTERLSQFASDMAIGMEDQLGIRLDTERIPVELVIVDHVEKPAEN